MATAKAPFYLMLRRRLLVLLSVASLGGRAAFVVRRSDLYAILGASLIWLLRLRPAGSPPTWPDGLARLWQAAIMIAVWAALFLPIAYLLR